MEVKEADAKYLVALRRRPTELGALPGDWAVIELATRATIQSGIAKNANAALRDPVAVPYLRVANVQDGYLDLREVALIEIERSDLNRYAVLPGDVLMNEGGDLDKLGRGALWHGQINPCVHQNHVFVVRCKTGLVPEYLNAWTSTAQARRYFMQAGRQTTNLASINKTSLGELTVAVPPTEHEQHQIAKAISDADALIDSLEQLLTKKRQIKQGAMQELLTGKRRLPGFVAEYRKMSLRALLSQPATYGIVTAGAFVQRGVQMVRGGDISDGKIQTDLPMVTRAKANEYARTTLRQGDVVIALVGYPGEAALVPNELADANISRAVGLLRPNSEIDGGFLAHLLNSPEGRRMVLAPSAGSAQLVVNLAALNKLELAVPPMPEQHAIASVLSDMDTEITALEARLSKARALKQAMAQALLTGRIRLVEPTA